MKIEVLMATMNRQSIEELELEKKSIFSNCLIINQVTNENLNLIDEEIKNKNIRMLSFREKGLSKSRNRALENAKGDICMIADDDVSYVEGYEKIIRDTYQENKKADFMTFQILTPENGFFKDYKKLDFKHNNISVLKVSSPDITFKRKTILENNLKFPEEFGLGSAFQTGEQSIWLTNCLKKGLLGFYKSLPIVIHPFENSGRIYNEKTIVDRGALHAKLFSWKCLAVNLIFGIKKFKEYKKDLNIFSYIKYIYSGSFIYLLRRNNYE